MAAKNSSTGGGGLLSRSRIGDIMSDDDDDDSDTGDGNSELYTYESDVDDEYEHFLFDYEPPEEEEEEEEEEKYSSPSQAIDDSNNGSSKPAPAPAPALWQLDPEESFSDWTIYITSAEQQQQQGDQQSQQEQQKADQRKTRRHVQQQEQEQDDVDVYHVHRNMLTCGLLQSEYFRKMFQSDFCETKSNTSRIPLVAPARKAFPLFLNLLYHPTTELNYIKKILKYKKLAMAVLGTPSSLSPKQPSSAKDDDDDDDDDKKRTSGSPNSINNSSNNNNNNNNNPADDAGVYLHQLVALLHLADFFQATKLYNVIFKVIRKIPFSPRLGSRFHSLYRQAAVEFSPPVQVVLDYMQESCAKCIGEKIIVHSSSPSTPGKVSGHRSISPSAPFWSVVSVEFIIGVVSSEHHLQADARLKTSDCYGINVAGLFTGPKRSRILSDLVAGYCWTHSLRAEKNKKVADKKSRSSSTNSSSSSSSSSTCDQEDDSNSSLVNAETFGILTQKDYLPDISFHAARKLLQLEKYYLGGGNDDNDDNDQDSKPRAASTSVSVTPKRASSSSTSPRSSNSDNSDEELTCLQTRCLTALQNNYELIDTANPSTDETLRVLKTSTLLSPSTLVDFMAKLCNQQAEKCNAMEREIKRFRLLPAGEAAASGLTADSSNNASDTANTDDSTRRMKPIYSCAPERFLPQHLHGGRDHDGVGGCPGHVLSRDGKRILFTYDPPPEPPEEGDEENEEEEEVDDDDEEGGSDDDDNDDDSEQEADSDVNNDDGEEEEDGNDDEQDDDDDSFAFI